MESTKKRLLIFIDWFYPGYKGGGPIQSCYNLVEALAGDYDIFIVTSDRDLGDLHSYPNIETDCWIGQDGYQIMYLSREKLRLQTIRRLMEFVKPDHIYINGMFSRHFSIYPLLVNFAYSSAANAKMTVAPRGMLLDSAMRKKQLKKKIFLLLSKPLFLKKNVRFHGTNDVERLAIERRFPGKICFVASNLGRQRQTQFSTTVKREGELRLIFVARIDPIKNLDILLDALNEVNGRVNLKIVGPVEDENYWSICKKKIDLLPSNIKVDVLGPVSPTKLDSLVKDSHLFVLLTKGENFGHSIFESFLAGRPVLISDQTPWKDLESKQVGFDVGIQEKEQQLSKIDQAILWNQEEFDRMALNSWKFASVYLKSDENKAKYYSIFS